MANMLCMRQRFWRILEEGNEKGDWRGEMGEWRSEKSHISPLQSKIYLSFSFS